MHVRWSSVSGMPVVDDDTQDVVAFLSEPLIDADTGRILAFYVVAGTGTLLLSVADILKVGTKIHIGSIDKLSPPEELVRLRTSIEDSRSFLGQTIRSRAANRNLGRCADLQFETHSFSVEWIFPRGWFFFGSPIPASDILEVTTEAIWVQDPLRQVKEKVQEKLQEGAGLRVPEVLPSLRR